MMYFSVTNVSAVGQATAVRFALGDRVDVLGVEEYNGISTTSNQQSVYSTTTGQNEIVTYISTTTDWRTKVTSDSYRDRISVKTIRDRTPKTGFLAVFASGQTRYYRAKLNIPAGVTNDEFFIEAFGGQGGYGNLDPTAWSYTQNFDSLSTASISGQDSWVLDLGTVAVVTDQFYDGSKSLKISVGDGYAHRDFTAIDTGSVYVAMRKSGGSYCEFEPKTNNYAFGWKIGWYGSSTSMLIQNAAGTPTENLSVGLANDTWYILNVEFQVSTYIQARARVNKAGTWTSFSSWITGYNNAANVPGVYVRGNDDASANNCWFDAIQLTDPTASGGTTTVPRKANFINFE
jgi:hypothetical protein